ncbi:hypothetical protein M3Y95_01136100 [Aphelenchoides besseyi]|nr:hypothetical protein M3Y95_01136100 [Aphelenchoides besseyi]
MVFKHVPIRERDAPYYHCLCGVHVHRGAFIIAIIGLIFSLVAVLNGFLLAQWLTLPLPIISVLLYIGVIIGNKKESPNLYLPYIIINTIVILFILGVSVFVILTGASVTSLGVMTTDKTKEKQAFGVFGAFTITFGVIFFLWGLISAYFVNVVYRAYRYLKDVVLLNPPPVVLPHEPAPVV